LTYQRRYVTIQLSATVADKHKERKVDNPNQPIIAVNPQTGEWEKVLDSQLPAAIARLGEATEIFRVDNQTKVVRRKDGKLVIRGISFPLLRN
jgi:hypothetical protein